MIENESVQIYQYYYLPILWSENEKYGYLLTILPIKISDQGFWELNRK